MSKFATPQRFEDDGTRDASGNPMGGTWYKPPPQLSWEMWPARVAVFRQLTGLAPAASRSDAGPKVLVCGCGYGYVCWHLWDQGFSAWGVDGQWAQGQALTGQKLPNIADHVIAGDCTIATDMANVRSQAGIGRNRRFDAVITDDLLSAADSAAEVQAMLTAIRNEVAPTNRARVIHFISMYDPTKEWSPYLSPTDANEGLYRSESDWITMIGNNAERIINIQNNHAVVR